MATYACSSHPYSIASLHLLIHSLGHQILTSSSQTRPAQLPKSQAHKTHIIKQKKSIWRPYSSNEPSSKKSLRPSTPNILPPFATPSQEKLRHSSRRSLISYTTTMDASPRKNLTTIQPPSSQSDFSGWRRRLP